MTFIYDQPYKLEDVLADYSVSNPIKTGHVSYSVKGHDPDGEFEGPRRYRDFHALRTHLVKNLPGIFIPSIPPKQMIGNKKEKFLENRMYFLDRFLKKIGEIEHLVNSPEFRCFSRPSGEVNRTLAMLPAATPSSIMDRLESDLNISTLIDEQVYKRCREETNDFNSFLKKIIPTLKVIKDQSEKMVGVKAASNAQSRFIVNVMAQYESDGLTRFVDQDNTK
jgi:sorting nexin-1/2